MSYHTYQTRIVLRQHNEVLVDSLNLASLRQWASGLIPVNRLTSAAGV